MCTLYECVRCTNVYAVHNVSCTCNIWVGCPWSEDECVGARERLLCVLPGFCIWCVLLYLFSLQSSYKKMNQIKNTCTLTELVSFHDMQMEDVNWSSSFFKSRKKTCELGSKGQFWIKYLNVFVTLGLLQFFIAFYMFLWLGEVSENLKNQ